MALTPDGLLAVSGAPSAGKQTMKNADELLVKKTTVPSTPATGYGKVYFSSVDGNVHFLDYLGIDRVIGGSVPDFKSTTLDSGAAGTYYEFGFYDAPAASTTINQAGTTQAYGTANQPHGAHAFIVAAAAGTATGGSGAVIITVTGTSITDAAVRTAADTETIVADVTTMATNSYYESTKKWIGTVTFTINAGATGHTSYAATFNYGLAKYEDFGNRKFTITDFEMVGDATANDTGFDIELIRHRHTGWTYSASAFIPGDGVLAKLTTDYGVESDLSSGECFAYKRAGLNTVVDGTINQGVLVRVTTGTNNSVSNADLHIGVEYN